MSISENITIGNKIKILGYGFFLSVGIILISALFHYIVGIKPTLMSFSISLIVMVVFSFFLFFILLSKYDERDKVEEHRVEVEEIVSKINDNNLIKYKEYSFSGSSEKITAINSLNIFVNENNIDIINIEQIYPMEIGTYYGKIYLWYRLK